MSLLGRAFVVTGSASGIGAATVKKLLEQAATVHAIDIAPHIPKHDTSSGSLWSYPNVNVGLRVDMQEAFKKIGERSPRVTGLVNCAGILRNSCSTAESDDTFQKLFDVNVLGTLFSNTEFYNMVKSQRQLQPALEGQAQDPASIVNIGSMASVRGIPGLSGYVASKHAVLGLTRSWAQEWGPEGFRLNCIAPGIVNTPLIQTVRKDMEVSPYRSAFKDIAEPEEVADSIIFLLSDSSINITGQVLEVNGGWA